MCISAILGLGAAAISAVSSNRASNAATSAQVETAQADQAFQRDIYNQQLAALAPYRNAGNAAMQAYGAELGLTAAPQGYDLYDQANPYDAIYGTGPYEASDRYNFLMSQGQAAIDGSAASQGSLLSSATLDRQQANAIGLASQDLSTWQTGQERRVNFGEDQRNNFLNRLTGLTATGQSSAAMQATAAGNLGQANSNALANIGDARAAGAIATGNALTNGINTGFQAYGYFNQLGTPGNTGNPLQYNALNNGGLY